MLFPPKSVVLIVSFLLLSLLFFYSLATLITYLIKQLYIQRLVDNKLIFFKSRKTGAVISITITLFLVLRILQAATILNTTLLLAIAVVIGIYLRNN